MGKWTFTVLFIIGFPAGLAGQNQTVRNILKDIEVFGGLGASLYFGDVGGKDSKITGPQAVFDNLDIDLWQVRGMITGGIRINPYPFSAFDIKTAMILVSGNDLRSNYAARAYAFNTWIWETSLTWEYYFAKKVTGFAPYTIIGAGGMLYSFKNNQSTVRSTIYTGNSLVMGMGLRLPTLTRFTHSIDGTFHFTTTDFLDGFKTSKNSKDLVFTLTYIIHFQLYTSWYYDHRGMVR
jgi:hypothetical protein